MDSIQAQVVILTEKVDELHHLIDQVNDQISAMLVSSHPPLDASADLRLGGSSSTYGMPRYSPSPSASRLTSGSGISGLDAVCEHKDVLVDGDYKPSERQTVDANLSQDIQIQRLTAQLTAAYHRIAALEEQLLATRVL